MTVSANDVLETTGFTTCMPNSDITVTALNIQYDRTTQLITFDVAGTSSKVENVTAALYVTAYGKQVYQKSFNPCEEDSKVDQLCPVPAGTFAARGVQPVPPAYASEIPSIAFNVPDLEGGAKLELTALDGGQDLACIESDVTNGKTVESPAVSYVAVGVAGAALLLTGISAIGSAGTTGGHVPSPSFGDVVGWFQSIAMNGMLSVQYPPIYRSFSKNFAFSGGLVPWNSMQTSIDNFRRVTGGNLTDDNVQYLQNASLVYNTGSTSGQGILSKRAVDFLFESHLFSRDTSAAINGTQSGTDAAAAASNSTSSGDSKVTHIVHGIQGYVEQLTIPKANTFMTVLLVFALVIAAITAGILLLKVVLESWALFGSFPKKLTNFRRRYWGLLARTITNLILLLYGVWTLYCIYQFTNGDSWAAKVLAGVTLALFSAILAFFTVKIWQIAQKFKRMEGDTAILYEDKETWRRYSLFYDNYKRGYWWLFMPGILYMFLKGSVIAAGNGHALVQTVGQLIIESLMLALVLFTRPFATTAGNWINVIIQVVRMLSVVCIMVFVEQLGIAQSTKTITGVVLIAVQSVLTSVLAVLIAVNAIIVCIRENPHRKQRKQAERINRDLDDLTPLDARNSLLINPTDYKDVKNPQNFPLSSYPSRRSDDTVQPYRDETPPPSRRPRGAGESSETLVDAAADMGYGHDRSVSRRSEGASSPFAMRQPTVPDMGYRGQAY